MLHELFLGLIGQGDPLVLREFLDNFLEVFLGQSLNVSAPDHRVGVYSVEDIAGMLL
jgi:hypothetical protein